MADFTTDDLTTLRAELAELLGAPQLADAPLGIFAEAKVARDEQGGMECVEVLSRRCKPEAFRLVLDADGSWVIKCLGGFNDGVPVVRRPQLSHERALPLYLLRPLRADRGLVGAVFRAVDKRERTTERYTEALERPQPSSLSPEELRGLLSEALPALADAPLRLFERVYLSQDKQGRLMRAEVFSGTRWFSTYRLVIDPNGFFVEALGGLRRGEVLGAGRYKSEYVYDRLELNLLQRDRGLPGFLCRELDRRDYTAMERYEMLLWKLKPTNLVVAPWRWLRLRLRGY